MKKIKSLDLFSGIGGLTLGLSEAGIQCCAAVDMWEDAGSTFSHNHKNTPFICADVTKISEEDLLSLANLNKQDIDIVVGGPPCQGFSTIGKRNEADPRNKLWKHYLRIVDHIRPSYILIENVEGMNVMKGGAVRDGIIDEFGKIGYRMKSKVLMSADYGVPQLRKRIVFLGWLPTLVEPNFPEPTHSKEKYISVKEAIADLPEVASAQAAFAYKLPPLSEYQKKMRNNAIKLSNHEAAKHPENLIEILKYIPDGGNRKSIPDHLQPRSGFHNSYARLASDKPAIAVTSNMRKPSSARTTHPTQDRGLTVREGLRLQSFPDSFVVLGTRTSQYLQVGNAVPPKLGEVLGKELTKAFQSNTKLEITNARATRTPIDNLKINKKQKLLFD